MILRCTYLACSVFYSTMNKDGRSSSIDSVGNFLTFRSRSWTSPPRCLSPSGWSWRQGTVCRGCSTACKQAGQQQRQPRCTFQGKFPLRCLRRRTSNSCPDYAQDALQNRGHCSQFESKHLPWTLCLFWGTRHRLFSFSLISSGRKQLLCLTDCAAVLYNKTCPALRVREVLKKHVFVWKKIESYKFFYFKDSRIQTLYLCIYLLNVFPVISTFLPTIYVFKLDLSVLKYTLRFTILLYLYLVFYNN